MKTNRTMLSAVLSIALLGLTLTGTLALPGCKDADKEREQAQAARAELVTTADQADSSVANLEVEKGRLDVQIGRARSAMDQAPVESPEWAAARAAEAELANQRAEVEKALKLARDAVAQARVMVEQIDNRIAEGDKILAQDGEEKAAGAAGAALTAIFPPAAFAAPLLIPLAGWIKTWRAAKVYRGERDLLKRANGVIVQSIEAAKVLVPGFGDKFKEAAAVIDLKQREAGAAVKAVVDAAQGKV